MSASLSEGDSRGGAQRAPATGTGTAEAQASSNEAASGSDEVVSDGRGIEAEGPVDSVPAPRRSQARVAWPDDLVVRSDKNEVLAAFVRRKMQRGEELTPDVARAARQAGIVPQQVPSTEARQQAGVVAAASEIDQIRKDQNRSGRTGLDQDGPADELRIVVGSSKPHAAGSASPPVVSKQNRHAYGSLRNTEPESSQVLRDEAFPTCNVPPRTEYEKPPERPAREPRRRRTSQIIPLEAQRKTLRHAADVELAMDRARRGDWRAAIKLRPEPKRIREDEALTPEGRGAVWQQEPGQEDVPLAERWWREVFPSSYGSVGGEEFTHDPPVTKKGTDTAAIIREMEQAGLVDKQLISWYAHGFPAVNGAPLEVVLGVPHNGMLKHAKAAEAKNEEDVQAGYITAGMDFPQYWPCTVDCCNIAERGESLRLCIDKTISLFEGYESFNDRIDLEEEERVQLVSVGDLARGAAILAVPGAPVKLMKFDLKAYFRFHRKQRLDVRLSTRCIARRLFNTSLAIDFGERHAPDHTGRGSSALAFRVKQELQRLDLEYPSRDLRVAAWCAQRLKQQEDAGVDCDKRWVALFHFLFYVDDAGMAAIDDLVFSADGVPVRDEDGKQVTRAHWYFSIAITLIERLGFECPASKQAAPDDTMDFLGIQLDMLIQRRLLSLDKRRQYSKEIEEILNGGRLPNGCGKVGWSRAKSLTHKLQHAASTYALGRQMLFYLRKAIKAAASNKMDMRVVILDAKAVRELIWWRDQLADEEHVGLPFASRSEFPTSSDDTIVYYGDSSREMVAGTSGFGAWCVIQKDFLYIHGLWTDEEGEKFSINVTEALIRDWALFTFVKEARSRGLAASHATGFSDNSAAEMTAETAKSSSDPLHEIALARNKRLLEERVHAATHRVTSVDNTLADWLSRQLVEETIGVAEREGLRPIRLEVDEEMRSTRELTPSPAAAARERN